MRYRPGRLRPMLSRLQRILTPWLGSVALFLIATPLETACNWLGGCDLGNGNYAAKRAVYERSDFQITQAIAERYGTWNEQKTEACQKHLGDIAAGFWRIDFGK